MVRPTLITSLVAAAYATVTAANVVGGSYIVELADGHDHSAVLDHIEGRATTRMTFDHDIFRGLSIRFHDADSAKELAKKMAGIPAVRRVWPLQRFRPSGGVKKNVVREESTGGNSLESRADKQTTPAASTSAPAPFAPHVMTQVDKLHAKGVTGKNIKIALVDSGIDYKHPALGGCFGKGCLVSFGTDFVGDNYDGSNTPVPDDDPNDCMGVGTASAGVIAAQKNPLGFTGAAPGVTLGSYRVFGCSGVGTVDVFIAAVIKAYRDGADIITVSVAAWGGWQESPWSLIVSRIVARGTPCVAPAGDYGQYGLFFVSNPADGKLVTSVTSFDTTESPVLSYGTSYSIDGGCKTETWSTPGDSSNWAGLSAPLYATSLDTRVADDACKPLPASTPDLGKYITLVRRGGCTFDDKIANVVAKGGKYLIVYNDSPGTVQIVPENEAIINATAMVTPDVGATWVTALKAGKKVVVDMPSYASSNMSVANYPNTITGSTVDVSSSWGPTYEMDFKPQFGAPTSSILTTYPRNMGSYSVQYGTFCASAMVSAIMALILEVRGKVTPALLKELLSSTAAPQHFSDGNNVFGELAPAAQQGAGLVQAYDAAYATTLLSPANLSFNDTDHMPAKLTFTLANKSNRSITYKFDEVPALTMYTLGPDALHPMPFPNEAVNSQASLTFSQNDVTVRAGQSVSVDVTAKPASGVDPKRLAIWSGFVHINGTDGSALSLPYQGLTGSLRNATVLEADNSYIFPSSDPNQAPAADGHTYLLPAAGKATDADTLPVVSVNLTLGTAFVVMDLYPLTSSGAPAAKPLGELAPLPIYLPRAPAMGSYPWDGALQGNTYAPEGKYKVVTRALRIFGDYNNTDDWDHAPTQTFEIKYKK